MRRPLLISVLFVQFLTVGCAGMTSNVGGFHHCTRADDETAKCWGWNHHGQIGDGSKETRTTSTAVDGISGVKQITVGANHSCALLANGTVKCWGAVGDKTLVHPALLPEILNARQIAAGDNRTCVLTHEKRVFCFQFFHDMAQELSFLHGATQITMAHNRRDTHGCARMEDATAKCWDHNNEPQELGALNLTGVKEVATNQGEACALLDDRSVTCWGHPDKGQREPRNIRPIANLQSVEEIAMGGAHTCARLQNGTVSCWGFNASGQVGITDDTYEVSIPTLVGGLDQATRLELGGRHSCAWTAEGTLYCWGSNIKGQLGDGTQEARHTPRPVHFDTKQ